ncbi:MAG: DUF2059 domain-containing protein [Acidobacteria bacterium]|jgi:hypothetical protein|nr:DUF2059 domain-containing protein [Acidobacteriota bacterium]
MQKLSSVLIVVACLGIGIASPAASQEIAPAFKADIETLLEVTGSANIATQMATAVSSQLIDAFKAQQPGMPDRAAAIIKDVLATEFSTWAHAADGLQAKTVASYARHFTHDEIRGLITFYRSDLGRKAIAEMPALMAEGMAIGQAWSQANMPRIMGVVQGRLRAEGLIK